MKTSPQILQNNQDQLDDLIFSLSERITPTLVWISTDSISAFGQTYLKLRQTFKNYKFIDVDISSESGTSLVQMIRKNLSKDVLFSEEIKHIVNVVGLDSLIGGFGVQQIIHELNFERDILFKSFPCIIIIWSSEINQKKVKTHAGDFWDWLTNNYVFYTEVLPETQKSEVKIFIDYSPADADDCKQLIDFLKKSEIQRGLDIWSGLETGTEDHIQQADIILILLSSNYLKSSYLLVKQAEKLLTVHNKGEKIVLPVLLRDCQWKNSILSQLQVLPTNAYPIYDSFWKNKRQAYKNVISSIISAVQTIELDEYDLLADLGNQVYLYGSFIIANKLLKRASLKNKNSDILNKIKLCEIRELIQNVHNRKEHELILNGIELEEIPDEIFSITTLQSLKLENNHLKSIPNAIARLKNLTTLSLSKNVLVNLPVAICQLTQLRNLDLWNNKLTALPESIGNLRNITSLDLRYNELVALPESIGKLQKLTSLKLDGNPLEIPPPEIVGKGVEAIKEYLCQLEQKDYIYEAKLLIVGEAGAGKTTLAKKILNSNYELQENEKSTAGIDVIRWEFPLSSNRQGFDKKFRVNIWDFGGQEIYHATHQFFLTKRSLYALVADTRKEDTDFYYWLNVIELLSGNSPILIIKNEKQDRKREIQERQLRGQFTGLKKTLATNFAANRGLPEILMQIKHHISSLPHIGSALPKTWVNVRGKLEKDPRNYISLEEYLDICQQNRLTKRKDKLQLSGYLHDLGVCLHFQDDPLLKRIIILNPEWGTYAVYKVLDNKDVIKNFGRFTKADLSGIWNEDKYANMQDELLRLMLNFRLCYKIPDIRDTYIAPQLLTENQPNYIWNETNNLILQYTYEFMPKGILILFIVAMNKFIWKQKYVWKSGVILDGDETKAEIIEYYGKRKIKIRIAGKYKKELMAKVVYQLDKIHASYHRLKYAKMIPCSCEKCRGSQNPHFYEFETLKKRIRHGRYEVECDISYEMVKVKDLIDDVM
ncbi:MAG: TIR domain-containing protein [Desulfobulbaceae bacterium]|nr:TIR domain-containing protein [Desulfobulbaceae bacterium]